VTFLSKEGARFDEARGVLELASAPAHCDGPALAVELGDHPEPDFCRSAGSCAARYVRVAAATC
jgi:hypothetical protein